jgi:hypothetical protein
VFDLWILLVIGIINLIHGVNLAEKHAKWAILAKNHQNSRRRERKILDRKIREGKWASRDVRHPPPKIR